MPGSERDRGESRSLVVAVTGALAVNVLLRPQVGSLTRAGWEVTVVCSPGDIHPDVTGDIHALRFVPMSRSVSPVRDLRGIAAMTRMLRSQRPAVVVGSTPKAALISMVSAALARVPVRVFQVRGAKWEGDRGVGATLTRLADRVAARSATDVVAVSASLADLLVTAGVVRERPRVLLRGGSKGVDTTVFTPATERSYDPASPLLGFAGRLSVDKGMDEFMAVVRAVRAVIPGLRVQLVGDVDSAQPIPPALVDELTTSPFVDWRGAVPLDAMPDLVRSWDLLLFPSHREGLPNVVLEAAASGVPTVAWDVTGVRDCVDDPRGGRLVARGDVDAMARAVIDCLDPDRHAAMRDFCVGWARDNFEASIVNRAFVDFLDEACRRQGLRPPSPAVPA